MTILLQKKNTSSLYHSVHPGPYSLAKHIPTKADFLAFPGSPAPSMLPTLIPVAIPIPYGAYDQMMVILKLNQV